ncbi:MAG TPA: RDD family protein [Pyrinomonadaceae bacterium]|nr:RDD family protein [Pyrinomonadaceae bacterium]
MASSSPQDSTRPTEKRSTLIEFPGVSRNSMPEWRKELSERVREVQEKRAREAAREAAEAERQRVEAAINPPQLELLPPAPMPAMNPLVAAALKRIERAHQTAPSESRQPRTTLATAVAYAPEREDNDMSDTVPSTPELAFEPEVPEVEPVVTVEKTHHLAVVTVSEPVAPPIEPPRAAPKRLIRDDNDPALNYLDSISKTLCVDDLNHTSASAVRRTVCALLDLIFCALLSSPIAGAMYLTGSNLRDPQVIGVLAGSVVVVTFLYLTSLTALTGRTWAMRLLSLRIIDTKTGLIPTGRQSIGRSFFYLLSLATVVGIFFALVSREGYTVHDRFTRTAVVTS